MDKERIYQNLKAFASGSETATPSNSLSARTQHILASFFASKQYRRITMAAILIGVAVIASKSTAKHPPIAVAPVLASPTSTSIATGRVQPSPQIQSLAHGAKDLHGPQQYADNEHLTQLDVTMLAKAQHRIDITMPSFTDLRIAKQLAELASTGIQIRVYRDSAHFAQEQAHATGTKEQTTTAVLRHAGIPVSVMRQGDTMGVTGYVVDDTIVRTGLAGWAPPEGNDIIFTESPASVTKFDRVFGGMWNRSDNYIVR